MQPTVTGVILGTCNVPASKYLVVKDWPTFIVCLHKIVWVAGVARLGWAPSTAILAPWVHGPPSWLRDNQWLLSRSYFRQTISKSPFSISKHSGSRYYIYIALRSITPKSYIVTLFYCYATYIIRLCKYIPATTFDYEGFLLFSPQ